MPFVAPLPTNPSFRTFRPPCQRISPQPENNHATVPTRRRSTMVVEPVIPPFSTNAMTVDDFFARSFGEWRSQRSSHNLAWTQFEAVTSDIHIKPLEPTADQVRALCAHNHIATDHVATALEMSWEGESDWDDQVMSGQSVMAVIKDSPRAGSLLRSVGYAETIPAVGQWQMTDEGVFVLRTFYEAAAAEERIWFATPDLRMRVSQIRTSSGAGVVTASFSTEIRRLNTAD